MTPKEAKDQAAMELFKVKYDKLYFHKNVLSACSRAVEIMAKHARAEHKRGYDEGVTKTYHRAMGID
jgi:ribosomal protein S27AE